MPSVNPWREAGSVKSAENGEVSAPVPVALPGDLPTKRGKPPSITKLVQAELDDIDPRTGKTLRETVAKRLVYAAANGHFPSLKEVLERIEGKVPDRIAGADGGPVQIELLVAAVTKVYGEPEARAVEAKLVHEGEG